MFGPVSSHRCWGADRSVSFAMNGVASRARRQLDQQGGGRPDHEGVAVVDLGTAVALGRSGSANPGDVEAGQRRRGRDRLGLAEHRPAQLLEQLQLQGQRALGGARDPALQLCQLLRAVPVALAML